jgi:hypothetical protein
MTTEAAGTIPCLAASTLCRADRPRARTGLTSIPFPIVPGPSVAPLPAGTASCTFLIITRAGQQSSAGLAYSSSAGESEYARTADWDEASAWIANAIICY